MTSLYSQDSALDPSLQESMISTLLFLERNSISALSSIFLLCVDFLVWAFIAGTDLLLEGISFGPVFPVGALSPWPVFFGGLFPNFPWSGLVGRGSFQISRGPGLLVEALSKFPLVQACC